MWATWRCLANTLPIKYLFVKHNNRCMPISNLSQSVIKWHERPYQIPSICRPVICLESCFAIPLLRSYTYSFTEVISGGLMVVCVWILEVRKPRRVIYIYGTWRANPALRFARHHAKAESSQGWLALAFRTWESYRPHQQSATLTSNCYGHCNCNPESLTAQRCTRPFQPDPWGTT